MAAMGASYKSQMELLHLQSIYRVKNTWLSLSSIISVIRKAFQQKKIIVRAAVTVESGLIFSAHKNGPGCGPKALATLW